MEEKVEEEKLDKFDSYFDRLFICFVLGASKAETL